MSWKGTVYADRVCAALGCDEDTADRRIKQAFEAIFGRRKHIVIEQRNIDALIGGAIHLHLELAELQTL